LVEQFLHSSVLLTALEASDMTAPIESAAVAQLFNDAHTYRAWTDRAVDESLLRELYETMRWAPTSLNSNPGRFVFVRSPEGKERLCRHVDPKNVEQTMTAACCVIVAEDLEFYELLDQLVPGFDVRPILREKLDTAREHGRRNTTIQGAYLVLAARALGLDAGPMQGFDNDGLDADFFPDGRWKSDFLINLGYGAADGFRPRGPRLCFEDACRLV
jgi:3-hydroxypropanoate dehydrogenase